MTFYCRYAYFCVLFQGVIWFFKLSVTYIYIYISKFKIKILENKVTFAS